MNPLTSLDLAASASRVTADGAEFGLTGAGDARRLLIDASAGAPWLGEFEGDVQAAGGRQVLAGPLSARNAEAVRRHLPWLRPRLLGLQTSAGFGDRLGLATPGHVRALRAAGGRIAPVFAQQSIREMTRTSRTPQQVVDDATWGAMAEGWREGFGADADHLKQAADVDNCLGAGFTFFTIDPGDHVDPRAESAEPAALRAALEALPWDRLEDSAASFLQRFRGLALQAEGHAIEFDEHAASVAAVKYGRAVAHVVQLYRHLEARAGGRFELEVSLDETDTPTSHAEHAYVATELTRLGVRWVSLAPRFVGSFEKGVDYIGDVDAFRRDIAVHAAIARALGPYKLSLHSGSDKFSLYAAAAEETRGAVHVKTAGTSYLEALRAVAMVDPELLREIYVFARERYETDRASYYVSARLDRAPASDGPAAALPAVLDDFDARQILHVTFGSVLTAAGPDGRPRFAGRLRALLGSHPEVYATNLERHLLRHLAPFVRHT